jgi:hypothetical protein
VTSREPPPAGPYAPLVARLITPVAETARRALVPGGAEVVPVPCPKRGLLVAWWARLTRCLYDSRRDGLGVALSTDPGQDVTVTCDRCRVTRHTSGQSVGRNLHNGKPPLS